MGIIEELKNTLSISHIYPKRLRHNRGECALHENSSSPSFVYYPDKNSWHCFSCGVGGDVINLYAHIHNLTNSEAIKKLAKQEGISFSDEQKIYYRIQDNIKKVFEKVAYIAHTELKDSKLYEKIKKQRGFTDDTMEMFKVGLYNKSIDTLIKEKLGEEALIKSGFLTEKGTNYFKKRVIYPYINQQGVPTYFIYRIVDADPDFMKDAKYIKHRKTDHIQEPLFGINSIATYRDKPLIITEGITDAMSVIQCGYPCLSPVTTKFKDKDVDNIVNYAKQFTDIVIINDNEKNQRGLMGAKKTLQGLLQHGIYAKIGILPRPKGKDKIDLDEFLKTNGVKGLKKVITESIEGFTYFCTQLDDTTTQKEIIEILELLPAKDIVKKKEVFSLIKDNTNRKVNLGDLKDIYKKIEKKREEEKKKEILQERERTKETEIQRNENGIIYTIDFKNDVIELRDDGIWKVQFTQKGGVIEEQVLDGSFELIHKTKYYGRDYFSYKFRGDIYNTQSRTLILMEVRNFMYGGERGKDIIKKVINELGDELEYKQCKQTLGFDNGWVLPCLEDKKDYKILVYTDIQRRIYNNCTEILEEYSPQDIQLIKKKLERFLDITQIDKKKQAIIIGWAIGSVFKLPLLKYFKFFPGLLLQGDKQSGKTYFCNFFVVDFFGAWKKFLSGGTIKTEARCEDILATSTFPVHLDELEYVKYSVIEILKATLTGVHDYVRKLNLIEEICKPEISPFCITTNEPPKPFLDPALNSKMLILNFNSDEQIEDDSEWIELYNELHEIKLFSFIYEYTKDWKNEDVKDYIKDIMEKQKQFKHNSRLNKKYMVVKFGLYLFRDVFEINLIGDLEDELFEFGERVIMEALIDKFLEFCRKAIEYETDYVTEEGRKVRGSNPKFLTCKLYKNNNNVYIFKQDNLRDFNEFANENYSMKKLGNLLNEGIKDKSLINKGVFSLNGEPQRAIAINENVFELEGEELEALGYTFSEESKTKDKNKNKSKITGKFKIDDFPEYNKDMYLEIIDMIDKDEYNEVHIDIVKDMLIERGYEREIVDINVEVFLEKGLVELDDQKQLTFGNIEI
ncbi:MAG: hypothetical protein GF317_06145 [Candidatus Lokiarchaeota archaeon]|nr:hypothetical protein [Candidatus Lokiarchaeota archaeon]